MMITCGEEEAPDIVFVTTPISTHVPLAANLAKANSKLGLFVEKPLAASVNEARTARERASSLEDALKGSSAVVIAVAHKEFESIDPIIFKKVARGEYVVFDGPRLLDPAEISKLGLTYLSVGFGTLDTKRYFQAKG